MEYLAILLWLPAAFIRAIIWALGVTICVPLSLIGDGRYWTPWILLLWADAAMTPAPYNSSRWGIYVWNAWRNPTPGLIAVWKQPVPEVMPNPDHLVRVTGYKSADRWMFHGLYWEYWYLRSISWGKYKWFEFRIGWKFVDGNDEFFPTLQLGPRSS